MLESLATKSLQTARIRICTTRVSCCIIAEAEPRAVLDEVIRLGGEWDAARKPVGEALRRAGLADSAVVAEGGGRLYPWPVGSQ